MGKFPIALILIAVAFACAALATFLYSEVLIAEVRVVPIDLQVDSSVGFNLDTDAIHLGRATSPGRAERGIDLNNPERHSLYAQITVQGNVAPFVAVDDPNPIILPNSTRRVNFVAQIPAGTPYGNYTGKARILFKRFPI